MGPLSRRESTKVRVATGILISALTVSWLIWRDRGSMIGAPRVFVGFEHPVVDLGEVPQRSARSAEVAFVNGSEATVHITGVHSSCGCVAAAAERDWLQPETRSVVRAELKLSENANGDYAFEKRMIVTCAGANASEYEVRFVRRAVRAMRIERRELLFVVRPDGNVAECRAEIAASSLLEEGAFAGASVTCPNSAGQISRRPLKGKMMAIAVTLQGPYPPDAVPPIRISVTDAHGTCFERQLPIVIRRSERSVTCTPRSYIQRIRRGARQSVVAESSRTTVHLEGPAKRPIRITKVRAEGRGFGWQVLPDQSAMNVWVNDTQAGVLAGATRH